MTGIKTEKLHKLFETALKKADIKVMKNNKSRHQFHLRAEIGDAYETILNGIIPCDIKSSTLSLS